MLIDHTHRSWIVGTFAVGMGAVTLYFVLDYFTPGGGLRGGDTVGLWYGVAGSALMVFAGLISALRRLPSWWFLGQRRVWLRGHVWLGLLSGVLILCHSHFRMGGPLEFLLMVVVSEAVAWVEVVAWVVLPGNNSVDLKEGKSLNSSADWIPISTLCSPESLHRPPTQPQHSKAEPELSGPEHLKALRQNTCYPPARRLIKVIATVALTLNALVLVFSVFAAVSQTNQMMARDESLFDTVFSTRFFSGIVRNIAAWIPILLLREGLLILVDMADSIVRLNPRSRDGLR
jgi:hypothetical protein